MTTRIRRYTTPEEAFAARTEWQGDCLVWTGGRNRDGYGYLVVNGRSEGAHRYGYSREHGEIAKGMVIDHKCHNRACANHEHLRAVTQKQNLQNPRGPRKTNSSGYLHVYWDTSKKKWVVRVTQSGKRHYGGFFSDKEEANLAAIELRERLRPGNTLL